MRAVFSRVFPLVHDRWVNRTFRVSFCRNSTYAPRQRLHPPPQGRAPYLGETRAKIGGTTWKHLDRATVEVSIGEKIHEVTGEDSVPQEATEEIREAVRHQPFVS